MSLKAADANIEQNLPSVCSSRAASLAELETHVDIAQRLSYVWTPRAQELLSRAGEVGRLLDGLLRFLRNKPVVG